jgi:hypothetical protein
VSSKTFDPDKITVEDLFRAKEQWRKEQAKLPFEKKIEILKTLQSVAIQMQKSERKPKNSEK